jgi:peroxiredoxin
MTARQQWQVVLGVVAALGIGLFLATRFLGDELFHVEVGNDAPGFSAATLDAKPTVKTLTDYRGKVVLLNIWATWCPPCREEMPSIQALHETFKARGFQVVAVSIDQAGDEQKVRDFVKQFGLTFEVLHDPAGNIQQIYQTTGVPENFLIGADGTIRKKAYSQNWNSEENRALVRQLLDEAGAPKAPEPAVVVRRPADDSGALTVVPTDSVPR